MNRRLASRLGFGLALALLAFYLKRTNSLETERPVRRSAERQQAMLAQALPLRNTAPAEKQSGGHSDNFVTRPDKTTASSEPAAWQRLFPRSQIVNDENVLSSIEGGRCRTVLIKTEDERLVRVIEPTDIGSARGDAARIMSADHVIVKKHPALSWPELEARVTKLKASIRTRLPDGATAVVQLQDFASLASFERALAAFSGAPEAIAMAEPDYLRTPEEIVNDPYANSVGSWGQPYPDQWSLYTAKVMAGWDYVMESGDVVVAVIDTGIDRGHPELIGQTWTNVHEIPGNGLDDDGNGYVDDDSGWNFPANNGTDLLDNHGHGTAMAGVIAAKRNNAYGIAGVGKDVKIMVLKNGNGPSFVSDNVKAMRYAVDNGARVINMSYSGKEFSQAELDAVNYAYGHGVVLVASSGNSGFEQIRYPAFHDQVISVGASAPDDGVAPFSTANRQVDFVAPGVDILSLASRWTVHDQYQGAHFMRGSGTSFSAAVVSGIASLLLTKNSTLTPAEVTDILRNTSDVINGPRQQQGYGRVNALRALTLPPAPLAALTYPTSDSIISGTVSITGTATSSSFQRYTLMYSAGEDGQSFVTLLTSTTPVVNGTLGTWNTTTLPDGYYTLQLEVQNSAGTIIRERVVLQIGNTYGKIVPGWPKSVYSLPGSGTAADVDGDGTIDFIGTGGYCDIGIVNSAGIPLPGWSVKSFYPAQNAISQAAVGDLDGDGNQEVVFETRYQSSGFNSTFTLHVYQKNGTPAPGWPKNLYKGLDFESHTGHVGVPVLADIDGDGTLEVLTLGANAEQNGRAMIYAFRADGSSLPGWPVLLPTGTLGSNSSPVAADFDGDGQMDVACITGNGQIFAVRADGTLLPGWPVSLGSTSNVGGTAVFADFDGDGEMELFVATESGHAAIYKASGAMLTGWPQQMPSHVYAPAVADLDGDGDLEIVIPAVNVAVGGLRQMYVWHHNGKIAAGWPYTGNNASVPIILDFDGDKKLDIVFSTVDYTVAFNFAGQMISKLGLPRAGGRANHCLAADFDGDGRMNLLVTESAVPFSIALLNYPTRPIDLDFMPWPQPGITAQKNSAYLPEKLIGSQTKFLKLTTETLRVTLSGKGLVKGHRVSVGANPCNVISENGTKLTVDLPNTLPVGVHDLMVRDAGGRRTLFPAAVVVVNNLDDYDGPNSPNTWNLRFQPELVDAAGRDSSYGPDGDLDGDGISNRLEFAARAMGLSPTRRDTLSTPPLHADGDLMVMDFTFDGTVDMQAVPEFSPDLVNWFRPGQAGAPDSFKLHETGPGSEPGLVNWRVEVSSRALNRGYLRLRFLDTHSP